LRYEVIEIVPVKQKLKGGKYNDKEEREQDQKVRARDR